jgi:transposase
MRDRFDHTLERKLDTKPGDVVVGSRLVVVTGPGRRRDWPAAEKARIIVESLTPGANVSEVARRNGLSPQQLFGWRREARDLFVQDHGETRARGDGPPAPSAARGVATSGTRCTSAFVPVVVTSEPRGSAPLPNEAVAETGASASRVEAMQSGAIEIAIGGSVVRVVGRVDADALRAVVDIVRRLACS